MGKIKTHYDNLQVTESAGPEVIKGAYRYLSQKWHPDKHPGATEKATRFIQIINEAFAVLSDPHRRREHDAWIRDQRAAQANDERAKADSGSDEPAQSTAAPAAPRDNAITRVLLLLLLGFLAVGIGIGVIMTLGSFGRKDGHALPARLPRSTANETLPAPENSAAPAASLASSEPESPAASPTFYPLMVVNECSEPLHFAMAFRAPDGEVRIAGWASLLPWGTGYIKRVIAGPSVFLYAESKSAQFVWNGDDHTDAMTALVSTENFSYDLAHLPSIDNPHFRRVKFFPITVQEEGGQFNFKCH